jgi:4-methyl-5(b-hydroxyethyl)-thiazole monophosphate biosynthesis
VTVAGLERNEAAGSHGIKIKTDMLLKDFKETPDAILIPGGPGAETLGKSAELRSTLQRLQQEDKWIGAICAAPAAVLAPAGILEGRKATCFPGYEKRLGAAATFTADRVVTDGKVVTSRGAGTAMEFSLELVRNLAGDAKAREIAEQILAPR